MKRPKNIFSFLLLSLSALANPVFGSYNPKDFTLDEKIGLRFIVAAVANEERNKEFMKSQPYRMDKEYVAHLITTYNVGGIIFLGSGTQEEVRQRMAYFQSISKRKLLGCIDAEWGLAMRLTDGMQFPRNMTLGATNDAVLIEKMAYHIGRQCTELGIHCNLAPVADVNNNAANPIINDRSFGDTPRKVAEYATAYAHGLRRAGVIACAKHFPGLGDTTVDSHDALPCIAHTKNRIENLELVPFKALIESGISAVMTAHLEVPALETKPLTPASLSRTIVTEFLRKKMGFGGLIITDGLGMKGVTIMAPEPGEVELKALLAGNDILLCPVEVPEAVARIKDALKNGVLSEQELDDHVDRILKAKEWAFQQKSNGSYDPREAVGLRKELYKKAITILAAKTKNVPVCTAYMHIGVETETRFAQCVQRSNPSGNHYYFPATDKDSDMQIAYEAMKNHQHITIVLHKMNKFIAKQFGLSCATIHLIHTLKKEGKDITLVIFGSPYSVRYFGDIDKICIAYEDTVPAQEAAAHACLDLHAEGAVPVQVMHYTS